MNRLEATVTHIASEGILHIVSFDCGGTPLQMMGLELDGAMRVGTKVILTIKSTYITLAKSLSETVSRELSYSNMIPATILRVDNGKLLSSIQLQTQNTILESIITADSSNRMMLAEGETVQLLIKASELSIIEMVDE